MASFPPYSAATSGGYYLDNLVSIAQYLMANGYSRAAAAGFAGTIAGESMGNPESQGSDGGGLIGWTPISSARPNANILTGNPQADWDTQLGDILTYMQQNEPESLARGGVSLATLKGASNPNQAATWTSTFFGPLNLGSDIRASVTSQVYSALSGYKPSSGYTQTGTSTTSQTSDSSGGILSWPSQVTGFFNEADTFVTAMLWITKPGNWVRIIAFLGGIVLLFFAIHALIAVGEGGVLAPKPPAVVPIPV